MTVRSDFASGNLLDGFVDCVGPPFCLFGAWHCADMQIISTTKFEVLLYIAESIIKQNVQALTRSARRHTVRENIPPDH